MVMFGLWVMHGAKTGFWFWTCVVGAALAVRKPRSS